MSQCRINFTSISLKNKINYPLMRVRLLKNNYSNFYLKFVLYETKFCHHKRGYQKFDAVNIL